MFSAAPDLTGAVGRTQYVQAVNNGYEVFDKATGTSVLGPISISSIWTGFGGVCEGNLIPAQPIVLYDQLADRWIITQHQGTLDQFSFPIATDECIAVSTTADASGSYNRYDFQIESSPTFFDVPILSVWPDAYYMGANVFTSTFQGATAVAFDRAKMLAGQPATFQAFQLNSSSGAGLIPAQLDGSTLPTAGAACPFLQALTPSTHAYNLRRFHVDFVTPANSTFGTGIGGNTPNATVTGATFTQLCSSTRSCVPQPATTVKLDGVGDFMMPRLAYRNFGDHEALVGNFTVQVGTGTSLRAGVRWFELRNITSGTLSIFQEATWSPTDGNWRWLGSAAMDQFGDLAVGYSISSTTLFPAINYAGRLAADAVNTLGQGETVLIHGGGSQTSSNSFWGIFSSLTLDPVDDCTFWYTNEYYASTSDHNYSTRIGSFRFSTCTIAPTIAVSRKTHGSTGPFDLNLPLTGNPAIECRSGGATKDYQMVVTFPTNVTVNGSPQAQVTTGSGLIGSGGVSNGGAVTVNGNVVTIPLTNISNAQRLQVTLFGVNDTAKTNDVIIPMNVLLGDTNADQFVDAIDTAQTKSKSGQAVNATNFREDVNVDGFLDAIDAAFVKSKSGTSLTSPTLASSETPAQRRPRAGRGSEVSPR